MKELGRLVKEDSFRHAGVDYRVVVYADDEGYTALVFHGTTEVASVKTTRANVVPKGGLNELVRIARERVAKKPGSGSV